jgi:hypothetical protein
MKYSSFFMVAAWLLFVIGSGLLLLHRSADATPVLLQALIVEWWGSQARASERERRQAETVRDNSEERQNKGETQ